ncbi:MAG: methylaspartate ammonia-lyase [Fusobacteria bacterium]|nr:methylaspartate ammonia-lyase [Fusobacteriota bacterium]
MKIVDVLLSEGTTGFYFDDQKAIKMGAKQDGFAYVGEPVTEGFKGIRVKGESVSVQLILEDGQVAVGDCAAVQYSGAGGRDPLFIAKNFIPFIVRNLNPMLIGTDVREFRKNAEHFDHLIVEGKRLHTAIRYGISQALLDATAKTHHKTMAEVIQKEYGVTGKIGRVDIFTQSGDDRYIAADKMIIKEAEVLPHALINNVEKKLGIKGELLLDYVTWLRDRVLHLRKHDTYTPIFHIDVYGTIGIIFNQDIVKQAEYIRTLEVAASPFKLRIEGPMDVDDRERQIKALKEITAYMDANNIQVEIVADEWCNTLQDVKDFADAKAGHMLQIKTPDLGGVNNVAEAIIYCKEKGVGAYCGGTCNETNISAECTTQIGMACGAVQVLAKPGMGVDEGYMIVNNVMNRVVALANRKK